ncbi:P-loop containing nucleoside triphosphate hydrolase [Pseudocohnilembus persalinus]|uniref:p-loop containing nucleoside triphosphate hydrolase n=1 Tax=Pseudocohnilembus persalinus TaxID=266149 RepID=A0A0V0R8V3_PSEPJ|nr:P-loop containing nucleoside triphosphate hydrolase [Pseudocohnilembus persalinus]|eukprot:KRX10866.1 P-loop containing nucleoside triphosphate hydrolase [Pseudocohnilembus persalinus]
MQQLECMQSFQRYQYQEVDGILLLVDVTDPLVKEQLQGFGEEFKYLKRDKSIYMVGNKSDLENERQISESELEELVKEMDFYYSEISAKSGNNVNKLFQKIVTECVNWYSVNDFEKNKITTNLQSNKLMVKVNNSKRKTSSFSATRNRQSSLVQFVQQKFGEQSGLNNNSGVQNQQSLSQGNLQEENNDNNSNDNQKNNLSENNDKNQENDQEFKEGEIEKKNQGQDLEKQNSKNSQNESDQNNNNKNQSENSSGHNLMNKGGIEIIQEENI